MKRVYQHDVKLVCSSKFGTKEKVHRTDGESIKINFKPFKFVVDLL